jgi:stalled ribosome alternative rescue factor ArfA
LRGFPFLFGTPPISGRIVPPTLRAQIRKRRKVMGEMGEVVSELMEEEIVIPKGEEEDTLPGEGETPKEEPAPDPVQANIEELRQHSAGIQRALHEERKQRQNLQGRLEQITEMIAKAGEAKEGGKEETVSVNGQKIPIDFDEDGNPYLDVSKLDGLNKKDSAEIAMVNAQLFRQRMETENERVKSSVVQRNEAYQDAKARLDDAYGFLDGAFSYWVQANGINPKTMTIDDAIEVLSSDPQLTAEFNKRYPGVDIDIVLEGHDTKGKTVNPRKFERALKLFTQQPAKTDSLDALKKLNNKPNSFAAMTNQRSAGEKTLNDLADMSQESFNRLSDTDIEKILRVARQKE